MSADKINDAIDLDSLRMHWQAHDRVLDVTLRLEARIVRTHVLDRVRTRLQRLTWLLGLELAILIPLAIALETFVMSHTASTRYLLSGGLVLVFVIALAAGAVRQLAALHRIDLSSPVIAMQATLESLRLERIRTTLVALGAAPLIWLPALFVLLQATTGVDWYALVGSAWIATNIMFGILVAIAAVAIARRYRMHQRGTQRLQRVTSMLAGETIADARKFLDELATFESAAGPVR